MTPPDPITILISFNIFCRLVLPTSPGDGQGYWRCEGTITPGRPIEQSTGQIVIDYLGPTESGKKGGNT